MIWSMSVFSRTFLCLLSRKMYFSPLYISLYGDGSSARSKSSMCLKVGMGYPLVFFLWRSTIARPRRLWPALM